MTAHRVAALFVQKNGTYSSMADVDCWDIDRDARLYAGPLPVVAHPPCSRWCRLAGLVEARWGHKRGEDGGLFEFALGAVRRWGGVLEHPAYTDAFAAYGLPAPYGLGAWQRTICGGWVVQVEQSHFGHRARKATWLYAFGTTMLLTLPTLPTLRGSMDGVVWCGKMGNRGREYLRGSRLNQREASKSPESFARMLVELAAVAARRAE